MNNAATKEDESEVEWWNGTFKVEWNIDELLNSNGGMDPDNVIKNDV